MTEKINNKVLKVGNLEEKLVASENKINSLYEQILQLKVFNA